MISIIVMAAGNGTRMKSPKAKVLHKICGREMILGVLSEAQKVSSDVKAVLNHQFEAVCEVIKGEFGEMVEIVKQDVEHFPGTAGAVKAALSNLKGEKTLIICGDTPLVSEADLNAICAVEADLVVAAFEASDPFGYGRVITQNGQVKKIVEQKDASEAERAVRLCNAGAYCFETALLKELLPLIENKNASGEFYLTDAVELAIKHGKNVQVALVKEENFMGVNDKFALAKAEESLQNRIKERWMKAGVIMHLPSTIFISPECEFVGECELEQGVSIHGKSCVERSLVRAWSVVESSEVVESDVGPMAHIRPQSSITKTHIGNFVELKKAQLTGVKAGHLSYLGDCEIGNGTNIGCGTITCNYDGVKKHKTIIGENVFVGSDTQFVAPVNIASHTLVAAGSTVTKDSNEGDLVISRTKQTNLAGFFFRFFGGK